MNNEQRTPYPIKVWNSGMGGVHYLVIEQLLGEIDIVLSLQVRRGSDKLSIVDKLQTMTRARLSQLWVDRVIGLSQLVDASNDVDAALKTWSK